MTVRELKERLEQELECGEVDEESEVLIAMQPSWPLQSHVAGVCTAEDAYEEAEHDEDEDGEEFDGPRVLYIVEEQQCQEPYAPREVWSCAR